MSIAPSVFVSSTCKDLDQVRNEIRNFIDKTGILNPLLSDSPSFPVNPDLSAIKNCLERVDKEADIFVLIVKGRYGWTVDDEKSVTNLEYDHAKSKGIPRYVFVEKNILASKSNWKENPSGDFSEIDNPQKLFNFIDLLYNLEERNWVYEFGCTEEIIEALRGRLAYLFMNSLAFSLKAKKSGLSDEFKQDLSGDALNLVIEKPFAWEYKLFSQVAYDGMFRMADIKRDLNYGLALGKAVPLSDASRILNWLTVKMKELKSFVESACVLINVALPKALGPLGEHGNVDEIVYVGKRLAEVYRRILVWAIEFRQTLVIDEFSRLLELVAQVSHNLIEEIEATPIIYRQQIDKAEQLYMVNKEPQSIEFTIKLTCPDMDELNEEVLRVSKLKFK